MQLGRVDSRSLLFAGDAAVASRSPSLLRHAAEIEDMRATAAVFRTHPYRAAPERVTSWIRRTLASGTYSVLEPN